MGAGATTVPSGGATDMAGVVCITIGAGATTVVAMGATIGTTGRGATVLVTVTAGFKK